MKIFKFLYINILHQHRVASFVTDKVLSWKVG